MDSNTRKVVCCGTTLCNDLQSRTTTFRDVLAKNRNERAIERAFLALLLERKNLKKKKEKTGFRKRFNCLIREGAKSEILTIPRIYSRFAEKSAETVRFYKTSTHGN